MPRDAPETICGAEQEGGKLLEGKKEGTSGKPSLASSAVSKSGCCFLRVAAMSRNDMKAKPRPLLTVHVDGIEVRPEHEGEGMTILFDVIAANGAGQYRLQHCFLADN